MGPKSGSSWAATPALAASSKVAEWTLGDDLQQPITKEVASIVAGFWSQNHQLQHVLLEREAAWKAGKSKENGKSRSILEKFVASQGLRALLNAEGVVKIQDLVLKFTADGQVLKQEAKGNFVAHPIEKAEMGRPKSLRCIRSFNGTQIQTINQSDRLVARLQMFHIAWFNRFVFAASSTYQRMLNIPGWGIHWYDNVTPKVGVFLYGTVSTSCSENSALYGIPGNIYAMRDNTSQASVQWMGMAYPSYVATRLSSLHGCLILPGFYINA